MRVSTILDDCGCRRSVYAGSLQTVFLDRPDLPVRRKQDDGDAYIFSEGDIVLAMRTSMSLPTIYAPVEHDGRLLVDGGFAQDDLSGKQLVFGPR